MKKIYFFIFFLLLYSCSKTKIKEHSNTSTDSLNYYISMSGNDTISVDRKLAFSSKALKLLNDYSNDSIKRNGLLKILTNYSKMNEWDKYKEVNAVFLKYALDASDTLDIAKGYNQTGFYYSKTFANDSAYLFYSKAEKLLNKIKNNEVLLDVYLKKATVQFYSDDYLGAELSASNALKTARLLNDKNKEYHSLNILGVICNEFGNYKKAIEYHEKALKVVEENKSSFDTNLGAMSLNNIGYTYQNLNKNTQAITYFKKALNDKKLYSENPSLYATLIDNIAYSNFKLNKLKHISTMFYKGLRIRDSLKLSSRSIYSKIHLSEYYSKIGNQDSSKKIAVNALNDARAIDNSGDILLVLKQLSKVDAVNSSKYYGEYIRISDSLNEADRKSKDKFARIQFETDEIIKENDQLEQKNRDILNYFMGAIIIGGVLFFMRIQRSRSRELALTQAQQQANEEIYRLIISHQNQLEEGRDLEKQHISKELHDGVLGRLFGLRLNLDGLNNFDDEESKQQRLDYLNELKVIEQDLREISHELNRENRVVINNFLAIINNLLEQQAKINPAKVKSIIDVDIDWDILPNMAKINLYRILQEALQNINKYAEAKNILVHFRKDKKGNLLFNIEDDGVGYDVNSKKSKGIGIKNIVARTQQCQGIIDIKSEIGKGSKIIITFPLENKTIKL